MFGTQMQENATLIHSMGLREAQMPVYPQLNPADVTNYYQHSSIVPLSTKGYNGSLDDNGNRSGTGNCTWEDGSFYEGDWKDNLRHGNGKFSTEYFDDDEEAEEEYDEDTSSEEKSDEAKNDIPV